MLLEQLCRQQMHQVPTASQPAQPDVQQQQQASGWAAASATSKHQLQSGAAAVARKAAAGMDRLLAGELQAEQARKEFVQVIS